MSVQNRAFLWVLMIGIGCCLLNDLYAQQLDVDAYEGLTVQKIQIKGLNKTMQNYVLGNIDTTVGEPLRVETIQEDFKRLEQLGYFSNIIIRATVSSPKQIVLTLEFESFPVVGAIVIRGESQVERKDIIAAMTLKPGSVYRDERLVENKQNILQLYQKKGFVSTTVQLSSQGGSQGKVNLIVDISEGKNAYIESIQIIGLKNLNPDNVYDIMKTRESTLLRGSQVLEESDLNQDRQRIEQYLKNNGYWLGRVKSIQKKRGPMESSKSRQGFFILIEVEEGEQFTLNEITIRGNSYYKTDFLRRKIDLDSGDLYRDDVFRSGLQSIMQLYYNQGYLQLKMVPKHKPNADLRQIDIDVQIMEGEKVHIENIKILGQDDTKVWVIDRELKIFEGELFNYNKIQKSLNRLKNTQFFSMVDIKPTVGSEYGLTNLEFNVVEQKTGLIIVGVGYGTVGGFTVFEEVMDKNFLGTGWLLRERIELGTTMFKAELGASTRWFLPYLPLTFDVSFRYLKDRANPRSSLKGDFVQSGYEYYYKWQAFELDLSFGYYFSDDWLLYTGFLLSFSKAYSPYQFGLQDINQDSIRGQYLEKDLSRGIAGEFLSKVSHRFGAVFDTRDLVVNTRDGVRIKGVVTFTGLYGGDSAWIRWQNNYAFYFNPFWKVVLFAMFGYEMLFDELISGRFEVRHTDRVRFDGMNELRGWASTYSNEVAGVGGKLSLVQEIRFSIFSEILWGVIFADEGNVTDRSPGLPNSLRYFSFGFGFRLNLPMFPIRLYFARLGERVGGTFNFRKGFEVIFSVGGIF